MRPRRYRPPPRPEREQDDPFTPGTTHDLVQRYRELYGTPPADPEPDTDTPDAEQ